MSAPLPEPVVLATDENDQFLVSHGKSGVIGVFTLATPGFYARGQSVIVQTARGVEIGAVLGPASIRQARLFGAESSGLLMRGRTDQDASRCDELAQLEQQIFDHARAWATRDCLPLEILDVDLFFDGLQAIVQFVGADDGAESFAQALEQHFRLTIRLENLSVPAETHEHRCDKPDCGSEAGGGCSSCSTGGGCSTCGSSSKVDLRGYFAHLRSEMEQRGRIPLA